MQSPLLLLFLSACGVTGMSEDEAKDAAISAAAAANPAGRVGLELIGKNAWYEAPMFNQACMIQHDLAFPDDPASRPTGKGFRISPTYQNQRYITAGTERGWCLYLGDDPTVSVVSTRPAGEYYEVEVKIDLSTKSPWFQCLDPVRMLQVHPPATEGGRPEVKGDMALTPGDCPRPLPEGEIREGTSKKPRKAAPNTPSREKVIAVATAFDQALYDGDYLAALDLMSCWNLFEEPAFQACAPSEILNAGPLPRKGEPPPAGFPWLEGAAKSLDKITRITPDPRDNTRVHAHITHRKSNKDRSFALQWVDSQWKVLGIVETKAEGLTTARFLTDLHDPKKHEIFEKRLAGEEIDEKGRSLNPRDDEKKK